MNPSEKLNSLHAPALARLKEKWRTLQKSEQDYWRAQFNSSRTSKSIRSEMAARLRVMLIHDVQLTHFRRWLAEQDKCDAATQKFVEEISAMMLRAFSKAGSAGSCGAVRWLYYQCLRDLKRRAQEAFASERPWSQSKTDKFYYDALLVCYLAWLSEPVPGAHLN